MFNFSKWYGLQEEAPYSACEQSKRMVNWHPNQHTTCLFHACILIEKLFIFCGG